MPRLNGTGVSSRRCSGAKMKTRVSEFAGLSAKVAETSRGSLRRLVSAMRSFPAGRDQMEKQPWPKRKAKSLGTGNKMELRHSYLLV